MPHETRRAAIDVGSNSVLLLVAEPDGEGGLRDVEEHLEVTRLSDGVGAGGALKGLAMDRTAAAVAGFVARARALGVPAPLVCGTAGLRNATNAGEFLDRVRAACGAELRIISGDEEARCAYLAGRTTAPDPVARVVVVDIGGASTEFAFGRGPQMEARMSLPVGAVRLTEAFLPSDPVRAEERAALAAHLVESLREPAAQGPVDAVIGIAGTFTDLAAVHLGMADYAPRTIEGVVLDLAALDALVEIFAARTVAQRREVVGLHPKRADVILAGAMLAAQVPRCLGASRVIVSRRGLRHGLLLSPPAKTGCRSASRGR